MCGIYFTFSVARPIRPDDVVVQLLRNRGPDSFQQRDTTVTARNAASTPGEPRHYHLSFSSSVLYLRGDHTATQPFLDEETGSILCWNGEAWQIGNTEISGNDGETVFNMLLHTATSSTAHGHLSQDETHKRIKSILAAFDSIRGPFAFVYYDALTGIIFFGRDCLGRRSLLTKTDADGTISIASVCTGTLGEGWHEIEADGVYASDISMSLSAHFAPTQVYGLRHRGGGVQAPMIWQIPRIAPHPETSETISLVSSHS